MNLNGGESGENNKKLFIDTKIWTLNG